MYLTQVDFNKKLNQVGKEAKEEKEQNNSVQNNSVHRNIENTLALRGNKEIENFTPEKENNSNIFKFTSLSTADSVEKDNVQITIEEHNFEYNSMENINLLSKNVLVADYKPDLAQFTEIQQDSPKTTAKSTSLSSSLNKSKDGIVPLTEQYYDLYKLVIVGDVGVGKSRVAATTISEGRNPAEFRNTVTIHVEFFSKCVSIDGNIIKVQLWDTAGQERFRSITSIYYRAAVGAYLVYDITSMASFQSAQRWYLELREAGTPNLIIKLLGNKCDLHQLREVPTDVAAAFARQNDITFIEVSAFDGTNLSIAFLDLIRDVYTTKNSYSLPSGLVPTRSSINLSKQILITEKKSCPC